MSKGKFANKRRKNNSSKLIVTLLTIVMVLSIGIGGTLAWLTDDTDEVVNEFTTSDIGVELDETDATYKMIPGWTIDKDPWAKVTAASEDCYLFVKVTKENNFDNYMEYAIDSQWTQLLDANGNKIEGVYYIEIDEESEKDVAYNILGEGTCSEDRTYTWTDNQVLTKPSVTKEMMNAVTADNQPTLSFQAYAVQLWKSNESADATAKFTPAEAWAKVSG